MKNTAGMLAIAAALWAAPAHAQSASAMTAGPVINLWYGGLVTGVAAVKETGSVFGLEAGARVWRQLDLSLEGGSFGNVVPQAQYDRAQPLTAFLQESNGQTASATVKMPALYGGLGARWVFEDVQIAGWARPYVHGGIGGARVKRQSTFTLGGANVTSSLEDYGVKLGADFTGTEKPVAFTMGAGVLVPYRMLYIDLGYRLTTIRASDAINVNRFNVGVGARF